jgi:hypothetical protein
VPEEPRLRRPLLATRGPLYERSDESIPAGPTRRHDLAVSPQNDTMVAFKDVGKARFVAQIALTDFSFERERVFGSHDDTSIADWQFFGDLLPFGFANSVRATIVKRWVGGFTELIKLTPA